MNKREECLRKACECVNVDRNSEYGEPENNLGLIAEFWSSYLRTELTPADVANMMVLLKVARADRGENMYRNLWIIGIANSDVDGVYMETVFADDEEIKSYLIKLVSKNKTADEDAFVSDQSCEIVDDIIAYSNDEYYAYASYLGYHIDYTAVRATSLVVKAL